MACCQGQDFDRMFDARRARRDMRAYSKRGARGATRRLLDAVQASMRERGTTGFTHLDIGGGVGVLQHELARDGAVQTTAVDASRPYLQLLRQAAAARGYEARQRRIDGDFTQVADSVEPATIVTLDKVICCYPDMVTLVRASAREAHGALRHRYPARHGVGPRHCPSHQLVPAARAALAVPGVHSFASGDRPSVCRGRARPGSG